MSGGRFFTLLRSCQNLLPTGSKSFLPITRSFAFSTPLRSQVAVDAVAERVQKRKLRKRRPVAAPIPRVVREPTVVSMAIAESLNLHDVLYDDHLNSMFNITIVDEVSDDTLHFVKKLEYTINPAEISEIFVFRDGVTVFWNVESSMRAQILRDLEKYADSVYDSTIVMDEQDRMPFDITESNTSTIRQDRFHLSSLHADANHVENEAILQRFAMSQAFAASVKIGVWESLLYNLAEPLSTTTKVLTQGKIPWNRSEALKRSGEFAALRHSINLDCTLLNKDFYWERPELEKYYIQAARHFSLERRIAQLNKRLDYCEELVKMVDNMLALRHASTLEIMIIVLIIIEVFFDVFHFWDHSPRAVYLTTDPAGEKKTPDVDQ